MITPRSLGWEHWTNAVGLRSDEARRVARIKDQRERWETIAPLYDAGVTKEDVAAFWAEQPFDLGLPNIDGKTPAGNCDLCFLKSAKTISALLRADPSLADWWIRMEEEAGRPSRSAASSAKTVPTIAGCGMPSSPSRTWISANGTRSPTASATNRRPAAV